MDVLISQLILFTRLERKKKKKKSSSLAHVGELKQKRERKWGPLKSCKGVWSRESGSNEESYTHHQHHRLVPEASHSNTCAELPHTCPFPLSIRRRFGPPRESHRIASFPRSRAVTVTRTQFRHLACI